MVLQIFLNLNNFIILSPNLTDFFLALNHCIAKNKQHIRNNNTLLPDFRVASTKVKQMPGVFPQTLCTLDKIYTRWFYSQSSEVVIWMQWGIRLTKYNTFTLYLKQTKNPNPTHSTIKWCLEKVFTFSTGFWAPQFSACLWSALKVSFHLHESKATQFSMLHSSLTFSLPALLRHNLQIC